MRPRKLLIMQDLNCIIASTYIHTYTHTHISTRKWAYTYLDMWPKPMKVLLFTKKTELYHSINIHTCIHTYIHSHTPVDKLLIMEGLKSMKASINNDFSFYRRYQQYLADPNVTAQGRVNQHMSFIELTTFLANHGSIVTLLHDSVWKVKQGNTTSVYVVAELLKHCVASYLSLRNDIEIAGKTPYIRPKDRHTLLRVLPLAILLLGSDSEQVKDIIDESDKLGKELKLKTTVSAALDILAGTPVVPLFADMQTMCYTTLRLAPWYNTVLQPRRDVPDWAHHFDSMSADKASSYNKRYEVRWHLVKVRRQHSEHMVMLKIMAADLGVAGDGTGRQWPEEVMRKVYTQMAKSMHVLGQWTALVLEQAAWKSSRPQPLPAAEQKEGRPG
jgi:hypothetical protein